VEQEAELDNPDYNMPDETPNIQFPDEFDMDEEIFKMLADDLELDLDQILIACPRESRRTNLINGGI